MWTVAVEEGLSPVRELLASQGHRVVDPKTNLGDVDAVVLTGGDDDFLGNERTRTKAPVIDARGRSADSIVQEISRRLG